MIGILDSKSSILTLFFIGLISCFGCKEKAVKTEKEAVVDFHTNIRFATKTDGYKEKSSFKRLKTDKTEITSTQFQMEGPTWENENVAFRNYFDARNGMDIFGKRTPNMVLDAVGIDENYHELQTWGMDILKVGNSLGAGAVALIINDSIYRMGVGAEGTFNIIEETPSSSTLAFVFKNWKVQDRTYDVTHTINIKESTHYYKGTIHIDGLKGDESLVTGIVDHGVETSELNTNNYTVLSTFGAQDVEHKSLGMAIAMDNKDFQKIDSASNYKGNVDQTHLIMSNKNDASYKFFAGWELQDKNFTSKSYFEKMIQEELAK